ncbi:hypothetical protein AGABI1DRAFT_132361 [Agaricus bisporus var. burnettii JB137-S8]|uniref:Lipid droplet-associated perilipin protein n=1 Tax=Agaricus bisporus var. burnettii (strain JB137-S8 / ATCC MYA-4627 / FGSC 10392) TaxID=597362 RepID=K5XLD6_AGABU|nr:uncharacterized protein AGABI1DRAFT_132361 [Agaricus bisporus var. burnettii JB137-S8]EKM75340.1 hypothetical protein AGABI1DRAFT_132361 [Agaricus bisporus var. burnettii JB137-S8]
MSAGTLAHDTPAPPQITVLTRVASIPLVLSSLEALDQTLSSNAYTRSVYPTAKGISSTAYKYTEPIQLRLAPIITRADSYANKAVDFVEARYPYPFKAKPEEVTEYVRERRQSVDKSFDENVKSPALHAAAGIDQRFAPIVDYLERAISSMKSPDGPGPSAPAAKYQYQRALSLTRQAYGYSNEQIKQIHAHSMILQRATEVAHSISTSASSSISHVQARVHSLSDTMVAELHKLQASTVSLSTSLQSNSAIASAVHSRLPSHVQQAFTEVSHSISSAASDLSSVVKAKDIPLQEKVSKIGSEVRERILPLLGRVTVAVADATHLKAHVTENGNGTNSQKVEEQDVVEEKRVGAEATKRDEVVDQAKQ